MADEPFDPTQFGAVAVEEPKQPFDPTAHGAIPIQHEEASVPQKIGRAVVDTLKGFLPHSVEEAVTGPIYNFPGIGPVVHSLANVAFGRDPSEGISPVAGIPVVQRIPEIIAAEKTPALSQQRFTTAAGTLLDLAMIAGAKAAPEIAGKPKLAEVAGITKPETPIAAATEPVPGVETPVPTEPETTPQGKIVDKYGIEKEVMSPEEVQQRFGVKPKGALFTPEYNAALDQLEKVMVDQAQRGEPNASQEPSTTSVTQPEVRTPVGEGTPLRQQGETPEARQGTEAGTQTPKTQVGDRWYSGVGPEGETNWVTSNLEKAKIYAQRRGEGGRIHVYTPEQVGETAFADQEGNLMSPQEYAKTQSQDTTIQAPPQAEGKPLPKPVQVLDANGNPIKPVVPEAPRPQIPEGAKATIEVRNEDGVKVKVPDVDANEYAGKFEQEKNAYKSLIDCLGK